MDYLIISDTHRRSFKIKELMNRQVTSVQGVFYLGDGYADAIDLLTDLPCPVYAVKGNCDWGSDLPAFAFTQENGYNIYCTHGYMENVKYGNDRLKMRAADYQAHIALYGHTHNPVTFYEDGIWFVNPGSIRDGNYAVIDLEKNGIMPVLMKI